MKVLIVGGSSLLGYSLTSTKPDNVDVYRTWYTNFRPGLHMDIVNKSQVSYVFGRVNPDVVIHCAAIGSVDYAEKFFSETHLVNVIGMRNVLNEAKQYGAKFVYISTNAVFKGDSPPYNEDRELEPVNRYGSIKREAEGIAKEYHKSLIIRPFLMYGYPYSGGRGNWFTTIKANLEADKVTTLVDDTYWQPTLANDVAQAIWHLLDYTGIYHVAADDKVTLYEFGLEIAKAMDKPLELIQPISSDQLNIAPRPQDTEFDLSKIKSLGIGLRGIEEGIKSLL